MCLNADLNKKIIKYDWEDPNFDPQQDKFMQRFDEDGNFVNIPKKELEEEIPPYYTSGVSLNYEIVENEKNEPKPEL